MTENIALNLISKLPTWFIMLAVSAYVLHKICDKNIKLFIRLVSKWQERSNRTNRIREDNQNNLIKKNQEDIEAINKHLLNLDDKINFLINFFKTDNNTSKKSKNKIGSSK